MCILFFSGGIMYHDWEDWPPQAIHFFLVGGLANSTANCIREKIPSFYITALSFAKLWQYGLGGDHTFATVSFPTTFTEGTLTLNYDDIVTIPIRLCHQAVFSNCTNPRRRALSWLVPFPRNKPRWLEKLESLPGGIRS